MSQSALLALRFQQNWMDRHPHDTSYTGLNLDDSLTSLGWLQNLKVSEFTQSRQQTSNTGGKLDSNRNFMKQEHYIAASNLEQLQRSELDPRYDFGVRIPVCGSSYNISDHRTNQYIKPPYSYASLICMAMKATGKNKITLASIYSWITDNFVYYRLSDPSWQNSIRHNLSLNKWFEKVARRKDEPGKGGFWRLKPEYSNLMEKAVYKKRRSSMDAAPSPPLKRFKQEDDDTLTACNSIRAREDRLLSNFSSDLDTNEDDSDNSLTLKGDLNWTNILNQDIEVGGQTIKAEDILNECENSPFVPMSPQCSETNCDYLGLDFLSQTSFSINLPLDIQNNDPLDLTVQGTTIRPPEWWTSDDNNNMININNNNNNDSYNNNRNSGLNTPAPPSPEPDHGDIIWGESLKLGSSGSNFDLDSLFAFDKIPSSNQLD